ncbi:efflux transporter outer membrane subunit [Thioalkalivibrio sp. AKL10]|uniref:efflux transporter outer membrane subunit n=1 Tax=Thioalkalivibrio sp. AKL10 TaxID=1158158 RepID=UPI000366740D|nr:efflux transporter outer membrane subunit [Thioalkalivibrio sp. AKL10]
MRSALPRTLTGAALALVLAGCAVGPDYERPEVALPEAWPEAIGEQMDKDYADAEFWWEMFEDPRLDRLVRDALENNLDAEIAAARVVQARAVLGLSRAEQFPRLDGEAEVLRENPGRGDDPETEITIAAVLSYEVDLWGRLARANQAARARLLNAAFTRDALRLAVVSDVVSTYFDYRATREQIETTEATIQSQTEALELERSRRESGATTDLTVRQAQAELETSRASLPGLQADADQQRRALAVLVGEIGAVIDGLDGLGDEGLEALPETLSGLPHSVPSDLITRRPDIRAAETRLIAANADIGVARAEWLPSLNLAALFGQEASGVSQLASGDSAIWELLVGSTVPLLDFGRRQATIDGVEAEYAIAELEYRLAIQEALVEVGNAWSVLNAAHERVEARQREMRARIEVLDLAERRYLGGFVGYLEVLDARRALLDASLTLTEASRDRLAATATLFRALGGGWDSAAIPSDVLEDGDPDDAKEEAVTPADPDD